MNKFIIFKLTEVSPAGSSFSDDGTGIQVISTPVDGIAYMTAKLGSVNIFLKDVSPYEDNNLSTGESIQRSFVTVSCTEGSEVELIQKIASFGSSDKGNPFITFDATASSTFGGYGENIKAFVKDHPINRVTGETSIVTDNGFTASTANTVNDIDFGATANKPILDLDCRDATYSGTLSAWANAGTGGSTYNVDISSCVGTINEGTGSTTNGFNTNPVNLAASSYAVLSNALDIGGTYTLYAVFSMSQGVQGGTMATLYGSSSGETVGLSATTESTTGQPVVSNTIGVRHEGRVGIPSNTPTAFNFDEDFPTVVVIRRDDENNIIAYDYKGRVLTTAVGEPDIPENQVGAGEKVVTEADTSGNLNIVQIGSAGGDTQGSFKGSLGRFGVISRDIGSAASIKLAKDLHELYNL